MPAESTDRPDRYLSYSKNVVFVTDILGSGPRELAEVRTQNYAAVRINGDEFAPVLFLQGLAVLLVQEVGVAWLLFVHS